MAKGDSLTVSYTAADDNPRFNVNPVSLPSVSDSTFAFTGTVSETSFTSSFTWDAGGPDTAELEIGAYRYMLHVYSKY